MQPGDRLVCAFVNHPPVGEEFKEWLLHVTIVPWFRTDITSNDLAVEAQNSLIGIAPFQVLMSDEDQFGHGKTVNLVKLPTMFMEVEERVRDVLKSHDAWLVDETTKEHRDYSPHVTAQKDSRLYTGDIFVCDRLYIVKQVGQHKVIESEIRLG